MAVKLLISDFDGTLVDTFEANFMAYRDAFESVGQQLSRERYRECFGYRFDRFMDAMNITDLATRQAIRQVKGDCYHSYFDYLIVNHDLLNFIRAFHRSGGKTAIASTARRRNLINALSHIQAIDDFDLILAGEDVTCGKPDPEIYLTILNRMATEPTDAIVFEDSEVGFSAAEAAGIKHITINNYFFGNGN